MSRRSRTRRARARWETVAGATRGTAHLGRLPRWAGLAAGVGAAALGLRACGPPGLALAVPPGLLVPQGVRVLARHDAGRRRREEEQRQLPAALDLLTACLAAGAPVGPALAGTAAAIRGPLGARLGRVAAALEDGRPEEEAWRPAVEPDAAPALGRVAHGVVRTARTGSALAPWLAGVALQVREEARLAAGREAERAGVLAVLPLGLCALPAYLLLGVVPAVAGLLHQLR